MQTFFITGTDTEVGKTYFTAHWLKTLAASGYQVLGYKPVAAGCNMVGAQPVNDDALALFQACNMKVTLREVNPIALMPPIAPHIAAHEAGIPISQQQILAGYKALAAYQPDVLLMEGAGGWQLPLGNGLWMPQIVQQLALPVIMVVGMRLGCLNHALLTAQSIAQAGLPLYGWVANQLSPDPMPYYRENLLTLCDALDAPLLAELPYATAPEPTDGLLVDILR